VTRGENSYKMKKAGLANITTEMDPDVKTNTKGGSGAIAVCVDLLRLSENFIVERKQHNR